MARSATGGRWPVLRGAISGEEVTAAATALAQRLRLRCEPAEGGALHLTDPATSQIRVTARWQSLPPQAPRTLGVQVPPPPAADILIQAGPGSGWGRGVARPKPWDVHLLMWVQDGAPCDPQPLHRRRGSASPAVPQGLATAGCSAKGPTPARARQSLKAGSSAVHPADCSPRRPGVSCRQLGGRAPAPR